jgi:tyrosyl-tRNA synthetase
MDTKERFELVKRNTEEILGEDDLKRMLEEGEKISAYYGVAPTGPVHIGYFATLGKIFDLMKAGIKIKILIADLHAALDDLKSPWSEIYKRAEYCKKCFELAFPWKEKLKFVLGSDFQLGHEYQYDVLRLSSLSTITRAKRATSEVTRMKNPKVSELIYPIMQTLDEQYLDVNMQLGGIDQRHIMAFAREYLPKIGYKARVEMMMPLIVSLKGPEVKMSASIPGTHIKIYESKETTEEKIRKTYCPEKQVKDNPILQICKFIIFPIKNKIKIERDKRYGGNVSFDTYAKLERAYAKGELYPLDLKNAVAEELINIFKKARLYFEKNTDKLKNLGKEFLP